MLTLNNTRANRAWQLAAASLAGLLISAGSAWAAGPTLKACADPDNLPFSSSSANPKGFYLDLADQLAKALGRTVDVAWQPTYLGKRAVRNTLLARECDLFIGLPAEGEFMGQKVLMSKPFAVFRYALVLPLGSSAQRLADLRGRRIAVQFASPPQSLLANIEGIRSVTVLSPEEGMRALAEGRADAAYLWGPSAGYLNKVAYRSGYQVLPTEGNAMSWPVAIGFRRADGELRETIQRELDTLGPWLEETAAKYGFPSSTPVPLAGMSEKPILLAAAGSVTGLFTMAGAVAVKTAAGSEAEVLRGRELFNSTCAHCHGPDAASPEKRIDLRRLSKRYGDKKDEVFSTTVLNGRPDKGMPIWKGVISDTEIASIKAFVDSVQQSN
jgi:polar amino acid transport system substrate-binding protein